MTAIMQIRKTLELFRPRHATIRLGLTPEDAEYELSSILKITNKFTEMAEQLASDNKISKEEEMIKAVIHDGKYDILCNAISPDFSTQYKLQLRSHETFKSLFDFLKSTFQATLSTEDKLNSARRSLAEITRFSKENESSTNFLKRIETLGANLKTTENTELFDLFTKEAFTRNLTPHHKACLNDHNQTSKSLSEQAIFLDERKKHLTALSVNQVESVEYSDLKAQIAALTALVQKSLISEPEPQEINKISADSAQPKAERKWSYKINGRPVRCQQCGLFGHTREKCRRTLKAICHKCGKQGHLKAVCRLSKNFQ